MLIQENCSLRGLNTFGVEARTRYLAELSSEEEFRELLRTNLFSSIPRFILGGGSNVLFLGDFKGVVIRNCIPGIQVVEEGKKHALVKAGAGVVWHELVQWAIEHDLGGIENLSLIPGSAGAAPIQNIGAYGAELKDVFVSLEAIRTEDLSQVSFSREECRFGYRDSFFKNEGRDKYIITSITLELSREPVLNTSYGAIRDELLNMGASKAGIREVSEAVCRIRRSKLPDPSRLGNAGSFFKNPVVDMKQFEKLMQEHPDMVSYPQDSAHRKLAAGWLIEKCGLKGQRYGDAGVHEKQALVLVNYGNAKGNEILALSEKVVGTVRERFGVTLEREVNVI